MKAEVQLTNYRSIIFKWRTTKFYMNMPNIYEYAQFIHFETIGENGIWQNLDYQ